MDTLQIIEAFLDTLDTAEKKNRSAFHSYRDTFNRINGMSVGTQNPYRRALALQTAVIYQTLDPYADELLRTRVREKMESELENTDIGLMGKQALKAVDQIEFKNCVLPKSRNHIDYQGLTQDLGNILPEEGGESIVQFFADIINDYIAEIDEIIRERLRKIFTDIKEVVSVDPSEEEWANVWMIINQHLGELDKEIRYFGDL
jgi:hypothetical protein